MKDPCILPQEIKDLPHWTAHTNKRPTISPDNWAHGKRYEQIIQETNQYGILVAPSEVSPYLFIDIDYPDNAGEMGYPSKKEVMAKLTHVEWGSDEHLKLIAPTLASISGTALADLITKTYTEFSPSGTGLHLIIRSRDKGKFRKAYKKSTVFKGQIDFKNQFMTITERGYPGGVSEIAEVPLMALSDAFGFKAKTQEIEIPQVNSEEGIDVGAEAAVEFNGDMIKLPAPALILKAMQVIPINQNKRIKYIWEELTQRQYEHYDFWLSIGMALHDYGNLAKVPSKMYLTFLQWSAQDEVSYTGEEDVEEKWKSFGQGPRDENITWRTILKLANKCEFNYPRPKINAKGQNTGLPLTNEYVNFEYLLNFYDIKLHEDDAFYVSGDPDICEKYFMAHGTECLFNMYYGPLSIQDLTAATTRLCQDSKWRGLTTTSHLISTWITRPRINIDLFKKWLDTPFDKLPENLQYAMTPRGRVHLSEFNHQSTLDYVFRALNVAYTNDRERELARRMLKKTLMQMIKFREELDLPFTDNGGMLILLGAENTYKSTFFKMLLPRPLDRLRKVVNMQIQSEKTVRDFIRNLSTRTIVQIDEFEGLMDQAKQGSLFKNIISNDSTSFVDIYQTHENEAKRRAIIVATSNETKQVISDNGSRRMWFIKVNKIDTEALLYINLHKLYNDLRIEFRIEYRKGNMPWLMSQDEIDQLYIMNESVAAKTDLGLWLEEIWPTTSPMPPDYLDSITNVQNDKSGKLYTSRDVMRMLEFRGAPLGILKLSSLEHALERHCGGWTYTKQVDKLWYKPKGLIHKGRIMQGQMPNGKYKYAKWIMPPLSEVVSEKDD
jgi:hypothetical protein